MLVFKLDREIRVGNTRTLQFYTQNTCNLLVPLPIFGPEIMFVHCSGVIEVGLTYWNSIPILIDVSYTRGLVNVKIYEICHFLSFTTLSCPQSPIEDSRSDYQMLIIWKWCSGRSRAGQPSYLRTDAIRCTSVPICSMAEQRVCE